MTQAKETGQAADTVVAENVINMFSRAFASSRGDLVWLINQNVELQTGGSPNRKLTNSRNVIKIFIPPNKSINTFLNINGWSILSCCK